MSGLRWFLSHSFTYIALGFACLAIYLIGYDMDKLLLWFFLPFYVISFVAQFFYPKVKAALEKDELKTDVISNAVTLAVVNSIQTWVLALVFAWSSSSVLIHYGIMDASFGLANYPLWLQALVGFLVVDFFFYVTHRMAHEIPFFWRFHSIHHCAHRVTFMNAYRVHPLDAMFRRYVPMFFLTLTGISHDAMVVAAVLGTVLATVTHLNLNLKHGWLNYIIATNELHRWHHSTKYSEAKNFAVFTLWDHLFGTFFYPKDRELPEKTGLGNEKNFPIHNYWQQLLLPFRWKQFEQSQKSGQAPRQDVKVAAAASVETQLNT